MILSEKQRFSNNTVKRKTDTPPVRSFLGDLTLTFDELAFYDECFPPVGESCTPSPSYQNPFTVRREQWAPQSRTPFSLCLFDLDDTLVRSSDLSDLREEGLRNHTDNYRRAVRRYFTGGYRTLISAGDLYALRHFFPNLRFGIVSKAPRFWIQTVAEICWPDFQWDIVIGNEDVFRVKPSPEGLIHAAQQLNISVDKTLYVGDSEDDVRAAYAAGMYAVLFTKTWRPWPNLSKENWKAANLFADAVIKKAESLTAVLEHPNRRLPTLEQYLAGEEADLRVLRCNKFPPYGFTYNRTPIQIYGLGRYFSAADSLMDKRSRHLLTQSILNNKESTTFPATWVKAVAAFVNHKTNSDAEVVLTSIPARPGRVDRMAYFLRQIEHTASFTGNRRIRFVPNLLGYREGVRSNHHDRLNAVERFENIRRSLFVQHPECLTGHPHVIVLDDVATTGATFYYADQYLRQAGAGEVTPLALSLNISDVFK